VRAKSLEELHIFEGSLRAADAVSAITSRAIFQSDLHLRNQLRSSSAAIPAHIAEGFGQKTDQALA
jgi:four helix bundle protein